jgi:hypothetical protein
VRPRLTAKQKRVEHVQLVRSAWCGRSVAPLLQPGRFETGAPGADT